MFVRANFVDIYSQGMHDRSMRSGTELAREIKLTDWSMAGNLSNRSSGVQIPRDICTCLKGYLYSAKCSCIINADICLGVLNVKHCTGRQSYIFTSNYFVLFIGDCKNCRRQSETFLASHCTAYQVTAEVPSAVCQQHLV